MNKKAVIYILIGLVFLAITKFLKYLLFANNNPLIFLLVIIPMLSALIFGWIGWCFLIYKQNPWKLRYVQIQTVGFIWSLVLYLIIFQF